MPNEFDTAEEADALTPKTDAKPTLIGHTTAQIADALVSGMKAPAFRAKQIGQAIYGRFARTPETVFANLPKPLREQIETAFDIAPCRVRSMSAADDGTVKYLMDLRDGEVIEAVFLPYVGRTSVCISSQVGLSNGLLVLRHGNRGACPQFDVRRNR